MARSLAPAPRRIMAGSGWPSRAPLDPIPLSGPLCLAPLVAQLDSLCPGGGSAVRRHARVSTCLYVSVLLGLLCLHPQADMGGGHCPRVLHVARGRRADGARASCRPGNSPVCGCPRARPASPSPQGWGSRSPSVPHSSPQAWKVLSPRPWLCPRTGLTVFAFYCRQLTSRVWSSSNRSNDFVSCPLLVNRRPMFDI